MARIFLTGTTGFIGSKILRRLLDEGHTVAVLVRPESDRRRVAACLADTTALEGRLEEPDGWRDRLADFRAQLIIHAAWEGVTGTACDDPRQADNVANTTRLAALGAELGIGVFVGLGSQAEYGQVDRQVDETAPTRPTTLYGMAKLAARQLCERVYARAGGRFVWVRIFSVYGPGDNDGKLFPYVLSALQRGECLALTACEQRLDYLYGEDAATAIVALALTDGAAGIFNLGSGQTPPLRDAVELLRDLVAPGAPLGFGKIPYREGETMHRQADVRRLTRVTGWRPNWSLRDGLAEIIRDFQARDA